MTQTEDRFETWAIVELLGHVRTAGRVTEEERFGVKLGRIDVPRPDGSSYTQYFSGGSIYRLTPCDEPTARRVAAASGAEPVQRWQLPAFPNAAANSHAEDPEFPDEDEDDPHEVL